MTNDPLLRETYVHGHAPAVVRHHGMRTAEEAAAFLLPELSPEMRLLDVGCGPGSITLGLAERLPRGEVVAIDLSEQTLVQARLDAQARDVKNLRYEYGSVYELAYPDASFDVAYAHQVFQHLADREAALKELLRVVEPGGRSPYATSTGARQCTGRQTRGWTASSTCTSRRRSASAVSLRWAVTCAHCSTGPGCPQCR